MRLCNWQKLCIINLLHMNNRTIPAIVVRVSRKSIQVRVGTDENVYVRAPHHTSEDYIQKILKKKWLWIKEKLRLVREQKDSFCPKEFVEWEGFLYLGRSYKLHVIDFWEELLFQKNGFYINHEQTHIGTDLFVEWYRKAAMEKIQSRVWMYAKKMGVEHSKISISNAEKRWGSCNTRTKGLNFSWRIIMAPIDVVDYIVVHELSHLVHPNHSEKFWHKVSSILPDYKEKEKWLKENHGGLRIV